MDQEQESEKALTKSKVTLGAIVKWSEEKKELALLHHLFKIDTDEAKVIRTLCDLLFMADKCIPSGKAFDGTREQRAEVDKKIRQQWEIALATCNIEI